jgi:hypothetical protein
MLVALSATAISPVARAQSFEPCRNAVQGHVRWNAAGDTHWAPQNIERLCRGGYNVEPAICMERVMAGTVSWGGGTSWEWENAVGLCHGAQDAWVTITCFENAVRAGNDWKQAIPRCAALPRDTTADCKNTLQGHIPWNHQGNTNWAPQNLERLCRGGNGPEPARCFYRLIFGQVDYGGSTNWEWENAVNLCHASQDHHATIRCFEGQVRSRIPWQQAITNCAPGGMALGQTVAFGAPPPPPPPPPDQMAVCGGAVQGRVPWTSAGDTRWAPQNVERLCRGGVMDQPARCFERLIRGQVSWGGGTKWEWENAVDLCHGSQDAGSTIACFQQRISSGQPWKAAIGACRRM